MKLFLCLLTNMEVIIIIIIFFWKDVKFLQSRDAWIKHRRVKETSLLPDAVLVNLNVDSCYNPYEFPEAYFVSRAKPITCKARAHHMIESCFLFLVISQYIIFSSALLRKSEDENLTETATVVNGVQILDQE